MPLFGRKPQMTSLVRGRAFRGGDSWRAGGGIVETSGDGRFLGAKTGKWPSKWVDTRGQRRGPVKRSFLRKGLGFVRDTDKREPHELSFLQLREKKRKREAFDFGCMDL